jgi:hypothetical protein
MAKHVEIKHSFELVLEGEESSLSDKLLLCNAFDGYEVLQDVGDRMVIDVMEFIGNRLILKISLKKPLTYKQISDYIDDMLEFAGEQTNYHVTLKPVGIRWDVREPGELSESFDESLLISHPRREEIIRRMDIKLQAEAESHSKPKYELQAGTSYISSERKSEKAFEIFTDLVTHGYQGLCVTRIRPEALRERYGLRKTPILWLTQNADPSEKCLSPTDTPRLHLVVSDFLEKAESSVVLLEGLEYIITHNNFPSALKLVQLLNDRVMLHRSRLLLPVDPQALGEKEMARLGRDMKAIQ